MSYHQIHTRNELSNNCEILVTCCCMLLLEPPPLPPPPQVVWKVGLVPTCPSRLGAGRETSGNCFYFLLAFDILVWASWKESNCYFWLPLTDLPERVHGKKKSFWLNPQIIFPSGMSSHDNARCRHLVNTFRNYTKYQLDRTCRENSIRLFKIPATLI